MLSFGSFWVLEALGYEWMLGDAALPLLFGFYVAGGLGLIRLYNVQNKRVGLV